MLKKNRSPGRRPEKAAICDACLEKRAATTTKKGMKLCPDPSSLQTKAIGRRVEKLVAPREQVKTTVTEIKVKKLTKTLYL